MGGLYAFPGHTRQVLHEGHHCHCLVLRAPSPLLLHCSPSQIQAELPDGSCIRSEPVAQWGEIWAGAALAQCAASHVSELEDRSLERRGSCVSHCLALCCFSGKEKWFLTWWRGHVCCGCRHHPQSLVRRKWPAAMEPSAEQGQNSSESVRSTSLVPPSAKKWGWVQPGAGSFPGGPPLISVTSASSDLCPPGDTRPETHVGNSQTPPTFCQGTTVWPQTWLWCLLAFWGPRREQKLAASVLERDPLTPRHPDIPHCVASWGFHKLGDSK